MYDIKTKYEQQLEAKVDKLEQQVETLKRSSGEFVPYPCPVCGKGMSLCTTMKAPGSDVMGMFIHACKNGKVVRIPKGLKPGQQSLLVQGLIGGLENEGVP